MIKEKNAYPSDWPGEGEINLEIHDLPHASSSTEWWYMNSHFRLNEEQSFSVFASFFRKMIDYDEEKKEAIYAHSLIWALFDEAEKKYFTFSLVDKRAPELGKKKLENGEIVKDKRLRRAALEVVNKGKVPLPDRLLKGEVVVKLEELFLDFDGNIFSKDENGNYHLTLNEESKGIKCEFTFEPVKPVIRHGKNGVVSGVAAEEMFYYFVPRCKVEGKFSYENEVHEVRDGLGWYDHEFGRPVEKENDSKPDPEDITKNVSWNWLSAQLNNGCEISAYNLFDDKDWENSLENCLVYIDESGQQKTVHDLSFEPLNSWTSTKTFNTYPTKWRLRAPSLEMDLQVEAAIESQEFITFISRPAFWEGRINISGTIAGTTVEGPGFVERSGFHNMETLDDFFRAVGMATLKSVRNILPRDPDFEKATDLICGRENGKYLEGLDIQKYAESLIHPIRDVIDRGGKSWRSYATLACCDIVGGDSQPVIDWLALPELMHSGSLIVDDVEDQSEIRRGKPSIHKIYGDAIAINAGTAAYFLGQICIYEGEIEDWKKLEIYKYYFEGLRAAHAGQALDIAGLGYMMPEIVKSGDGEFLERRVLSIHRLKSAVPASFLARMGCVLGGGSEEQVDALKRFFELIGLAFQIIDDTLNLKGFKDNLKSKAEDITHGKVTYPVAKAMKLLQSEEERRVLWEIVESKPSDEATIGKAVEIIDACGALEEAEAEAKGMVEEGWKMLDPLVEDSLVKMMLRAFSWYVLDRQY